MNDTAPDRGRPIATGAIEGACRHLTADLDGACRHLTADLDGACRHLTVDLEGACRHLVVDLEGVCRRLVAERFEVTGACRGFRGVEDVLRLCTLVCGGGLDPCWRLRTAGGHRRPCPACDQGGYGLMA
ncbi:hypothetical protein ACFYUY_24670 [Kitasatospora sp. NPDC004745]|uniref:hypothetical protein n=1 Tax=Kitasatospora sp. NPDC004745 TaxID=3364019 RepID=UPI0036BADED4